ncbi:MAG: signal transduction protein with Nacht domain protein, partial [Anaerolineae bacterium]|nr:signal transduction protein with Nacht domain protein [Anaerolineae bacterium]
ADLQAAYLDWLQRVHSRLELRGIRVHGQLPTVPLDRVFVALKGERTESSEIAASRVLLEEELRALEQDPRWHTLSDVERRLMRTRWIAHHPYMPSLLERDRPAVLAERKVEVLNLAEAFRKYRWLVILGDPGSGKTTLARWLALHLAQAYARGEARVKVRAAHVDPAAPDPEALIDLGAARFPVLVRVADFAEALAKQPNLTLIEYLGHHPWQGEKPTYGRNHPRQGEPLSPTDLNALIRARLREGKAVILLDGLDELTERSSREAVVRAVEAFIRDCISTPAGLNPLDDLPQPWRWEAERETPAESGGNQIVITSRIANYHLYPLNGRLTHVTIEPMGRAAIDRFCERWTLAVHQLTARPDESESEIENRARQEAESLQRAIHDPNRPGIAEMASNPLLLTILALVHHNTQARLPEQRIRLYQIAVENLVEVWRDTGLREDEVINILAPVAAHIHTRYATGLIPELELKNLLREPLARARGLDAQHLPPNFETEVVEPFLRTVRDQVGLLAARGDEYYGFLHLTFQEYFAARYLAGDPTQAIERIVAQRDDPRWREPILLALGFLALNQESAARERLLTHLLETSDPLADLLPRNALLVASALPEFVEMPHRIVEQVTRRLLIAYADREGIGRFEHLREQIERALARLR